MLPYPRRKYSFNCCKAASQVNIANAQNDWYGKYLTCVSDSDVHAWKAVIEQWEQAEPESPDVYAAWYNYYIKLAMTDVVALTRTAPENNQEALQLMDSTGVVAGHQALS